jgi:hypothetical protein
MEPNTDLTAWYDPLLSLLRHTITALGAGLTGTQLYAEDKTWMFLGMVLTAVGTAWGPFDEARHRYLTQKLKNATPIAALALLGVLATGCTTTGETDWATVNFAVKSGAKYTTSAVLDNNPTYLTAVAKVNAGVETLLVTAGEADTEALAKAIQTLTDLPLKESKMIASVLSDAVGYYKTKTGNLILTPGSPEFVDLVRSITSGIEQGVALSQGGSK